MMDFDAAMQRYRQNFFNQYPPVNVKDLRPGMKIVVPDNPFESGGGDLYMEVTSLDTASHSSVIIHGKLTQEHVEMGAIGNEAAAQSFFDQVGLQPNGN
jgi:hypothetical protein